ESRAGHRHHRRDPRPVRDRHRAPGGGELRTGWGVDRRRRGLVDHGVLLEHRRRRRELHRRALGHGDRGPGVPGRRRGDGRRLHPHRPL
ncbi:MAG: hypothetical protein AVDCRST_MAG54-948, partial [uncultured Actinomycetospora sp.]